MKRINVDNFLNILTTNITNRGIKQTKELLFMLDGDLHKLIRLEERIANNFISYCPGNIRSVYKILKMKNSKELRDIYKELNNHLYSEDIRIFLKVNNKRTNKKITKTPKQNFHKEYYSNYKLNKKDKLPKQRKKNKQKTKKKSNYNKKHYTQSKLICIMNTKTHEIIRIRKNEINKEIRNRGWKDIHWEYTSKTAYKTQQNKYKIGEFYNKKNKNGNLVNKYPFKNRFDKTIKVDLIKAFYIPKDKQIKIDGIKTTSTNEICKYQSKGYNKTRYITKQVAKGMLPIEQAGRRKVGIKIIEDTKRKLVKEKIFTISKNGKKKYVFKKILKEIPTKTVISIFKPIDRVKKYKKLIKKEIEYVPGKIIKYYKPKIIQATKFITSLTTLTNDICNNKEKLYDKIIIERKDRLGNIHRIPKKLRKILYIYAKSIKSF